jgi:hypothetical protein
MPWWLASSPARFFADVAVMGKPEEADAMATSHFEQMLKQQERAQAAAARRARARAQAKAAPKPGKTPTLDFLSGVFLIVGVAIAGASILAALAF